MVIWFSGTGNSRYCAEKIAAITQDECCGVNLMIKRGIKGSFDSEKPYVFVGPTYAWQLPRIFMSFIRQPEFKGGREAYFVMTCGDDIGCASRVNEAVCREAGLICKGTAAVKMPENYIAMFDSPSEEREKEIISAAEEVIAARALEIKEGKAFSQPKLTVADKAKSGIVNRSFYRLCVRSKAFYSTDGCISCGRCERLCPTNALRLSEGRPVWGKGCTHCMACISYCPTEAIEYGKKSVGKRRYSLGSIE